MQPELESVSIGDLRDRGVWVMDRVEAGELLAVTRDGHAVAMLSPLGAPRPSTRELIRRRRNIPVIDSTALRTDLGRVIDARL